MNPIGYQQIGNDKALLFIELKNGGLSDQLLKDYKLQFADGIHVLTEATGARSQHDDSWVRINGLKKRASQIEAIPIQLNGALS